MFSFKTLWTTFPTASMDLLMVSADLLMQAGCAVDGSDDATALVERTTAGETFNETILSEVAKQSAAPASSCLTASKYSALSGKFLIRNAPTFRDACATLSTTPRCDADKPLRSLTRSLKSKLGMAFSCGQWHKTFLMMGGKPWSSGYGKRLVFQRPWVRIPSPYTGWTFFHIYFL